MTKYKRPLNGANFIVWTPEHKILMVKQGYKEKFWALPGGGVETGESVVETAVRETLEETGITPQGKFKLVAIQPKRPEGLNILYSTALYSGSIWSDPEDRTEKEITDVRFMPIREIFFGMDHVGLGYKKMVAIWYKSLYTNDVYERPLREPISITLDGKTELI